MNARFHGMRRRPSLRLLAASVALAASAVAATETKVVTLPPFLVEEKAQPLPWKYAEVAGAELLSSCSDSLTRRLIANHHRLHVLLGEIVPPALQFTMTEKQTLLFVDSAQQPPTSQEVVAQMALSAVDQQALDNATVPLDDGRLRRRPPAPRYTFLPNLRLWDRDASTLFAIVRESEFDPNRVGLTPDYVAYILRSRLPALPPWYISGMLTLFARTSFSADSLSVARLDWLSETGSAALKAGPEANRAILPLAEFFAGDLTSSDPAGGDASLSLWQAQAALFVHWGLGGRGAPRRDALWRFVERAALESVTEKLFQECFGFDYATAQKQLTDYLPDAMRDRLVLRPAQWPRLPDYALRPAAEAEIARLRGDWERLEIAYVKAEFPALTGKYTEQARLTLRRGYDAGSRDPRLLAVMGLCEVDAGNDIAARDFLEVAAASVKTLRPRALYELARLRFAALSGGRPNATPHLTADQASSVLRPLLTARDLAPPLPEVFELMAEVWAVSSEPPARDQLALLESGVRLFPRRSELVYRTAELNLRQRFTDSARWLINLGLTLAPDSATRGRFEALQSQIQQK